MSDILTPISPGELLDKLTILQIKLMRISDARKLENVKTEHNLLQAVADRHVPAKGKIPELTAALLTVNTELWDIEDDIRNCERVNNFDQDFITLARAVYVTNDRRAALKREINTVMGSNIVEEKSYADY